MVSYICNLPGFNPTREDAFNRTSLVYSIIYRAPLEAIKILVHLGANVNQAPVKGSLIALHLIVNYPYDKRIIQFLLDNGIDIDILSKDEISDIQDTIMKNVTRNKEKLLLIKLHKSRTLIQSEIRRVPRVVMHEIVKYI